MVAIEEHLRKVREAEESKLNSPTLKMPQSVEGVIKEGGKVKGGGMVTVGNPPPTLPSTPPKPHTPINRSCRREVGVAGKRVDMGAREVVVVVTTVVLVELVALAAVPLIHSGVVMMEVVVEMVGGARLVLPSVGATMANKAAVTVGEDRVEVRRREWEAASVMSNAGTSAFPSRPVNHPFEEALKGVVKATPEVMLPLGVRMVEEEEGVVGVRVRLPSTGGMWA